MSLLQKTKSRLLEAHAYRLGKVNERFLLGFLQMVENQQGNQIKVPDFTIGAVTAQTSTASAAFVTGTGRLYGFQVLSGSLSAAATAASNDVIVQFTDNSIVIASAKCTANCALEVYLAGATDGVGITFGTDLKVKAVQAADGSSNPAAADRPDVVVIYGDDTVNTDSQNLLVTTFG